MLTQAVEAQSRVVGEAQSRAVGEAQSRLGPVVPRQGGVGETALREAIRKYRGIRAAAQRSSEVDAAVPGCVYGVLVGDRLDAIGGDVEEIRKEIAWIRNVIIGAVAAAALATVLRFMGWGG